jgi:hypothetical protein
MGFASSEWGTAPAGEGLGNHGQQDRLETIQLSVKGP